MRNYIINSGHVKYFKLKKDFNEIKYTKKGKLMNIKCEIDKIPSKKWERAKKRSINMNIYIHLPEEIEISVIFYP